MRKLDEEYFFSGKDIPKQDSNKKIKKLDEVKFIPNWKNLYMIFISIWGIDFFTTIIALNLPRYAGKLYEINPLSAWFYQFGLIGWIGAFLYSMITLFLLSWGVCKLLNKLKNQNYKINLYYAIIILFVVLEGNVIFNNLMMLLHYG